MSDHPRATLMARALEAARHRRRHTHHTHTLARRQFVKAAAGSTAAAFSAGLWLPGMAWASDTTAPDDPKPIPLVIFPGTPFHVAIPGPGAEGSTITDFDGIVGVALLGGTGTGTDTKTGATTPLLFDVDMRFMQGTYFGVDGRQRQGTFGFV